MWTTGLPASVIEILLKLAMSVLCACQYSATSVPSAQRARQPLRFLCLRCSRPRKRNWKCPCDHKIPAPLEPITRNCVVGSVFGGPEKIQCIWNNFEWSFLQKGFLDHYPHAVLLGHCVIWGNQSMQSFQTGFCPQKKKAQISEIFFFFLIMGWSFVSLACLITGFRLLPVSVGFCLWNVWPVKFERSFGKSKQATMQ